MTYGQFTAKKYPKNHIFEEIFRLNSSSIKIRAVITFNSTVFYFLYTWAIAHWKKKLENFFLVKNLILLPLPRKLKFSKNLTFLRNSLILLRIHMIFYNYLLNDKLHDKQTNFLTFQNRQNSRWRPFLMLLSENIRETVQNLS